MEQIEQRRGLTKEEAEAFIGNNAYFYMDKWRNHNGKTLKGWNWASMWFGIEWMAYRKMYLEAVIAFFVVAAVSIAFNFLLGAFGASWGGGKVLGDIFRLALGILGNMLYRNKALRTVRKTGGMDENQRLEHLKAKGGTSVAGVIGCILVEVALFILL